MKNLKTWMLAAILLTSGLSALTSCKKAVDNRPATEATVAEPQITEPTEVEKTELIRTSQSWDGVELPDYFEGRPELVAMKYVFPAGQKLGWHHHPVMNYGILIQGELTIIGQDGKEKTVHEGEPVVEMVNTIHHGENRGTKPAILYMFYLSQKDMPLAVQHPEIPLD
ncbi:MAG: cupin domain-containing protein [Prevotella sp.]|nr:cupin domain-containing protein [Prevotella sp.]